MLALGAAVALAVGLAVDRYAQDRALTAVFERLHLFHDLRQGALEDYLTSVASDVRAACQNPRVVDAMEKLTFAWSTFGPEVRKTLPRLYIEDNPAPRGEKDKLDDAGDGSYYSRYHRDFHLWAKRFRQHFGYYDVFLLSLKGDILYSVAKEIDFATSLKTGPYRNSPLAEVFRRAMAQPAGAVVFSDFARYPPSNDEPAAFAAHAVRKGNAVVGVFAVQIPAEPLNELMHFTSGMGTSGETYLVGPDGMMRSQSRFTPVPTLLTVKVDNASVADALNGGSGMRRVRDYRGIPVLSVYAPVDFGGQPWILLSEIDETEALAERKPWIAIAAGGIAGLVAISFALLVWRLTRTRPVLGSAR
jgi:methyl-accepting chemotaxis protein